MKHIFIFLFLIITISCKPKKDVNNIDKSEEKAMVISEKLESFGFFDLMQNSDKIKIYKKTVDEQYVENKWLFLPNNYLILDKLNIKEQEGISSADFRSVEIEGTSMYKGNLMSYLKNIKTLFDKRNLQFELGEEDMEWGEKTAGNHSFKHTVDINGKIIVFFDGNLDDINSNNPQIYIENTIKILNQELEFLKSTERFFMLTGIEGVYYILADNKMFVDFKSIQNEIENKILEF